MSKLPRCDCAVKVDALIKREKTDECLDLAMVVSPDVPGGHIFIPRISVIRFSGFHSRKTVLTPNYCPFCGKKYRTAAKKPTTKKALKKLLKKSKKEK